MARATFSGGAAMQEKLREIASKLEAKTLRVGFLEDATYPDGTSVATVAATNEFGGTVTVPEHETKLYRSINEKTGEFRNGGRFVKADQSNFETTHTVPEHTVDVPPRPFFRKMVESGKGHWGADLGGLLRSNDYDADRALELMGEQLEGELQQSIRDFTDPGNAPSTIAKKGFDKPLIETSHMLNSVDSDLD